MAGDYAFERRDNLGIYGYDGVFLASHMYVPVGAAGETFPVVIFPNSWGLGENEYNDQAEIFASQGYVTFSYTARGWYQSGGQINVFGDKDMSDISTILDYLVAQPEVDAENIGIMGVSGGAGMALLAAAHDARIKTAISMSGWVNLLDSLYGGLPGDDSGQGQSTPRTTWTAVLLFAGDILGDMDPEIYRMWDNLMTNTNVQDSVAWAEVRSPEYYVDVYNARRIPVYMTQNLQDQLFQTNQMERFFSKLNYDAKRLDTYRGIHMTGEAGGFFNIGTTLGDIVGDGPIASALVDIIDALGISLGDVETNQPWKKAHRWMDHHLKGIPMDAATGKEIMTEPKIQFKNKSVGSKYKDYVAPKDSPFVSYETWYLAADSILTGSIPPNSNVSIYSGIDTDASTGSNLPSVIDNSIDTIIAYVIDDLKFTPIIGGMMEAHLGEIREANLNNFTKWYQDGDCPLGCFREAGVKYVSGSFPTERNIVGTPKMRLSVKPYHPYLHFVTYLYEITSDGDAKLITHGPVTRYDVTPEVAMDVDFDLVFTNYTMAAGSKLAVVFDTQDPLYKDAGHYNERIKFRHGDDDRDSHITIPFANNATYYAIPGEFDVLFYLQNYADLAAAFGNDYQAALDHWLNTGIDEGRRGCHEFDAKFYLEYYADLKHAFGNNYRAALNHWHTYGINEGRRGSREFDMAYYFARYPDLAASLNHDHRAAIDYFAEHGLYQGHRGSVDFDSRYYLETYADLRAAFGDNNYLKAMDHWIKAGIYEGRSGAPE